MDDDALRKAQIEFLRERLATLRGEFEERALKAQGFNIRAQNVDEWVGAIAEQIRNWGNSSLAEEFFNAHKRNEPDYRDNCSIRRNSIWAGVGAACSKVSG